MVQAKVLVVEDEVIVARTIAAQLTQLGYQVIDTASSGLAAIDKANRNRPDLVLMDVVLKGEMDGVTAASQIRAQLDIPIVFLTAYADENTLNRAKNTLPLGYVVKPFSSGELRVAVELALFKHQMEQELRASREYLSTLLYSMNDAVIATDEQGQVNFMNPVAEVLTGWREQEALGQAITEVVPLVDEVTNQSVPHPVHKVLETQDVTQGRNFMVLVRRNGDRMPIGDSASPLRGRMGEISGAVMVFWDMSAYRQSEALEKALEKEQELNHLKSQFVTTVSHEFRNPLAVIRTAAELLELQAGNLSEEKLKSYLQRIKLSVHQMNQLIEDVLLMGRVEAGRLQFSPNSLNLLQFCQEVVEECSLNLRTIDRIELICPNDLPEAVMDETLLRFILMNLLSNAIKYSRDGGEVQLAVSCDLNEQKVTFRVSDRGIGIPEADQANLCNSFFRASNTRSIQGTGLGLAIVKRCVETHQGEIAIVSQVEVGTTVTVRLPLAPNSV
ncbi:MAG: ATP-binding protein [Leptolyngbyaceae cyanobacterium bins.59]|nr:ATP-binding protein [Leptolyngbyaceae cyanobacterium bins.59]